MQTFGDFFHFLVDLMAVVSATSRYFQRNELIIVDVSEEIEGGHHVAPITQNNKGQERGRFYGIL